MSLPPYFVPRVPGLPHESAGPADLSAAERRQRLVGVVALAVLLLLVAAALVAAELGLLTDGLVGTLLAVVFGLTLGAGLTVDLVAGLRRAPHRPRTSPGLRPASFLYLAAVLCAAATFAFLSV